MDNLDIPDKNQETQFVLVLSDLYRHMEWADAAVWKAVLASEAGRTDAKVREYLYHLHMVQHAFLRLWCNEPREEPYPTFDEASALCNWARAYHDAALNHLKTLFDDNSSKAMPVPWAKMIEQRIGRTPESTTVRETALQVILHSTYHRGQINARLREVGGEPPLVDYIAWLWLGRPAPDWSLPS